MWTDYKFAYNHVFSSVELNWISIVPGQLYYQKYQSVQLK